MIYRWLWILGSLNIVFLNKSSRCWSSIRDQRSLQQRQQVSPAKFLKPVQSVNHLISLYNITTESYIIMRWKDMIASLISSWSWKILIVIIMENVWRIVRRICTLMLGSKGLILDVGNILIFLRYNFVEYSCCYISWWLK